MTKRKNYGVGDIVRTPNGRLRIQFAYGGINPATGKKMRKAFTADTRQELHVMRDKFLSRIGEGVDMEAGALTWEDCLLEEATVKVNKSLTRSNTGHLYVGEPKTEKSYRRIGVSAKTVEVLLRQREAVTAERLVTDSYWHENNLVFPSSYGTYWENGNARRYMYKRLKKAGIPQVKFHTLRHTQITHALEAGENMFTVSRRAGHASVAFTMDRYGHVLRESQGIAKGVMDAYLDA